MAQGLVTGFGKGHVQRVERGGDYPGVGSRVQRAVTRRNVNGHDQSFVIAQPMLTRIVEHPPRQCEKGPAALLARLGRTIFQTSCRAFLSAMGAQGELRARN